MVASLAKLIMFWALENVEKVCMIVLVWPQVTHLGAQCQLGYLAYHKKVMVQCRQCKIVYIMGAFYTQKIIIFFPN
jgi:hypothetical protein